MEIELKSDIDVRLIQKMGGDHMVVAAARVSTSGEEALKYIDMPAEESAGVINYLMKHRHGTPFEHSSLTFFVNAPIFVWREWHRHRIGFSYNEESARYTTLKPVFYVPPRDRPMIKVDGWKPGRPKFLTLDQEARMSAPEASGEGVRRMANIKYQKVCDRLADVYVEAYKAYTGGLEDNLDPGLARDCLPVGIYSSCWVTCNPRSLMAFLSLRTFDPSSMFISYPLYEIEVAARSAEEILKDGWPITYKAFISNGRVGP